MVVEFDAAKNAINIERWGIGLSEFARLDLTSALIDLVTVNGEAREVVFATRDGRLHVGVITRRGRAIRVISLRKANNRERKRYESAR